MSSPPETRPCRVVLVGMMGSGKTTVGRLVAERTGWRKLDNDEILLALYGLTARQILDERGEAELRIAEDAALAHALSQRGPSIIDAAAGTILSETAREALREPVVVWLRASPETLFRRAAGARHRPWLAGGQDWIREADALRRPLYASVADAVMETDARNQDDVATEITERLAELCQSKSQSRANGVQFANG